MKYNRIHILLALLAFSAFPLTSFAALQQAVTVNGNIITPPSPVRVTTPKIEKNSNQQTLLITDDQTQQPLTSDNTAGRLTRENSTLSTIDKGGTWINQYRPLLSNMVQFVHSNIEYTIHMPKPDIGYEVLPTKTMELYQGRMQAQDRLRYVTWTTFQDKPTRVTIQMTSPSDAVAQLKTMHEHPESITVDSLEKMFALNERTDGTRGATHFLIENQDDHLFIIKRAYTRAEEDKNTLAPYAIGLTYYGNHLVTVTASNHDDSQGLDSMSGLTYAIMEAIQANDLTAPKKAKGRNGIQAKEVTTKKLTPFQRKKPLKRA